MQAIDESRLESDLAYRFGFLASFIGFTSDDAACLSAAAQYLGPMIPELVERSYVKLLAYDATARHFLPRQSGFDGDVPADLAAVVATHPQIQFRKEHLTRYFMQILGRNCDERLVPYLDMVGKIHTPQAGNSEISIPLVQMNMLMGLIADMLTDVIFQLPIDAATKIKYQRAFQKFMWIQNDFITRHYASPPQAQGSC